MHAQIRKISLKITEMKTAAGPGYVQSNKSEDTENTPTFLITEKREVRNRKLTPEETAQFIKRESTTGFRLAGIFIFFESV